MELLMADLATPVAMAASSAVASNPSLAGTLLSSMSTSAGTFTMYGMTINMMTVAAALLVLGLLFLFYRIQKTDKLDFADMITKDGKAVSLTKVLQLVGGVTSTWIMIKLTITGGLTEALFGLYLTYVGAIEGYSKFVAAKYNYKETSVKEVKAAEAKE